MSIDLMKGNSFMLTAKRSKRYPTQTITYADYANDSISGKYTCPSQHSLEWVAGGIGLHVNADKTEYICFNQRGNISTLNDGPLKLVDKFTYKGSSILSTENDINMQLAKT